MAAVSATRPRQPPLEDQPDSGDVPVGRSIRNPAFDVTPAKCVTATITEHGVLRARYTEVPVGIAHSQLLAIERGLKEPGATILFRIAKLYRKSIEWLMTGSGGPALSNKDRTISGNAVTLTGIFIWDLNVSSFLKPRPFRTASNRFQD
jgi:transcriptional regulator with XRE-family HTH domain